MGVVATICPQSGQKVAEGRKEGRGDYRGEGWIDGSIAVLIYFREADASRVAERKNRGTAVAEPFLADLLVSAPVAQRSKRSVRNRTTISGRRLHRSFRRLDRRDAPNLAACCEIGIRVRHTHTVAPIEA